jgi:hypothetical protein
MGDEMGAGDMGNTFVFSRVSPDVLASRCRRPRERVHSPIALSAGAGRPARASRFAPRKNRPSATDLTVAAAVGVSRAPVNNHFGHEGLRSSVANPYRRRSGSLRTGFTPCADRGAQGRRDPTDPRRLRCTVTITRHAPAAAAGRLDAQRPRSEPSSERQPERARSDSPAASSVPVIRHVAD